MEKFKISIRMVSKAQLWRPTKTINNQKKFVSLIDMVITDSEVEYFFYI